MTWTSLLGEHPVRRIAKLAAVIIALLAALVLLFTPQGGYEILRGLLASAGVEIVPYKEL